MPRAFIGLGSNTDPERNIAQSLRLLGQKALVIGVSTVFAGSKGSSTAGAAVTDSPRAPAISTFSCTARQRCARRR
jgi:hypothetical protein